MNDNIRIDSHKLHLHPRRVADWLEQGDCFPLYMEFSPSGACNYRCKFCGMDHMGYPKRYLETNLLNTRIEELGRLGLKSLMFAGEGEPLMHKDISQLAIHAKDSGIDVSFTTNGALLTEQKARKLLPVASWIKVSVNAAKAKTHAEVHRVKEKVFGMVIRNLETAIQVRQNLGSSCTLGVQMLLLPENREEALLLASRCRDIGVDYLVIKPYSQNPQSGTYIYEGSKYEGVESLESDLSQFQSESFRIYFRSRSMKKQEVSHSYQYCHALPFWAYLDSGGTLWSCLDHAGNEKFNFGNIYDNTFQEIWAGEQRRKAMEWFEKNFDCSVCRVNCRMDEINRYLWELKHPGPHVNFI